LLPEEKKRKGAFCYFYEEKRAGKRSRSLAMLVWEEERKKEGG